MDRGRVEREAEGVEGRDLGFRKFRPRDVVRVRFACGCMFRDWFWGWRAREDNEEDCEEEYNAEEAGAAGEHDDGLGRQGGRNDLRSERPKTEKSRTSTQRRVEKGWYSGGYYSHCTVMSSPFSVFVESSKKVAAGLRNVQYVRSAIRFLRGASPDRQLQLLKFIRRDRELSRVTRTLASCDIVSSPFVQFA